MPSGYAPAPGLLIESLGDGWVAFSATSGETILLNHEGAAIIEVLGEGVGTCLEVCAVLAADTGLDAHDLLERTSDAWAQLVEGGLIVSAIAK